MNKTVRHACFVLVTFALTSVVASANTYHKTINVTGGGTFSYTDVITETWGKCIKTQEMDWAYTETYSGFSYSAYGPLTGSETMYTNYCGVMNAQPITWMLPSEQLTFTPLGQADGSAAVESVNIQSGYVNPRYVILGVTYAPPGNQSFVQYTNSTMTGTSTSFSGSNSNSQSLKVSVSSTTGENGTIPDIGGTWGYSDTSTQTFSQDFTDEQDASSSVAISSTESWTTKVPGPVNPYLGVDHDYDLIWLWLNPLLNFTATQIGSKSPVTTWTGYSFDRDDIPEMDIYPVYLGFLLGHLSLPGPNSSDLVPFERAWAGNPSNGQIWPAGTSPSLLNASNTAFDPTDAAAIAAADPFSNPSYTVTVPNSPAGNETSSDGRFTLTGNQVVDYVQPPAGGQPFTQVLTESTTKTQTQGEGAKYTLQLGYSWENKFTASFLQDSWTEDITTSDTLTWIDQWSLVNTSQTGVSATGSVTGPPCVVSGTGCNPVYAGPTEYEVFQDNIYNTFMYYPVN